MAPGTQGDLAVSIARDAVQELAPHELPVFRRVADELQRKGEGVLKPTSGADTMLGSGGAFEVMMITQVALPIAVEVVKFLVVTILKEDFGLGRGVSVTLQRLRSTRPDASGGPPLTDQQLAQLRDVALGRALELKLPEEQAKRLVAALASSLIPGSR